ncbi:alpha/beta fold hydrolase [Myxococcus sp. 1LA]
MGVKLAYETWGEGSRPLVLLHGFTGSRRAFDGLRPLLGRDVRAVAVDLPGHGATPLPDHRGRDGFVETVDALVSLVDSLGQGPVDLLGYSQGAAWRWPRPCAHRTASAGSSWRAARPACTAARSARRREADGQLAAFIRTRGVDAFVDRWEQLPLFDGLRQLPQERKDALRALRRACTAEGLAGALECLGLGVQPDFWPALHAQRLPTLLLTGAGDAKFTQIARRMATELPVVWRHAFEGCGHAPHLESPEDYAREVLGFLQTPWYEAPQFDSPLVAGEGRVTS